MCRLTLFFLLALLISDECFLCDGMVIHPPGFGGGIEGDPAPGRSPGPPEIISPRFRSLDDTEPTVLLRSDGAEDDCALEGAVVDAPKGAINFSVNHELFKTELLVPGIIYEGMFLRLRIINS